MLVSPYALLITPSIVVSEPLSLPQPHVDPTAGQITSEKRVDGTLIGRVKGLCQSHPLNMSVHKTVKCTTKVAFVVVHEVDVIDVVQVVARPPRNPRLVNAVPRFCLTEENCASRLFKLRQPVAAITALTDALVVHAVTCVLAP